MLKKQIIAVGVSVASIGAALGVSHLAHAATIDAENTAVAVKLGDQGVTGIGQPDVAAGVVPFIVTPTCTVEMPEVTTAKGVTLYLTLGDGTRTVKVDTVTNAATATAVRANIVAVGMCK